MEIDWSTHTCSVYCTHEVHAFEFMSNADLTQPGCLAHLCDTFDIPVDIICAIRPCPEAVEEWNSQRDRSEWTEEHPYFHLPYAYLFFLRVSRPQEETTL